MTVKASELRLGDVVQFEGALYGSASVIQIDKHRGQITFARPYGHTADFASGDADDGKVIFYTGVEFFTDYLDSTRPWTRLQKGNVR